MNYLLILILIIGASGCSLIKGKPKAPEPAAVVAVPPKPFLQSSQVLDAERLKKGGRILVIPFTPGSNASANEESERVALMIVQGIADYLNSNFTPYSVLDAANASAADFILQGRILAMNESGRLKKMALRRNRRSIAVEGKMIDAKSGEIVLHFTETEVSKNRKQNFRELGSVIGQDIGKFLVSVFN